jgi:ABC-type branched-subunit amino acid transport system ATPase component/ABC-type branched-subunit amino acid transport system permease subunit
MNKILNLKRHGPMAVLLAVAALWVFAAPGYWVFTAASGVTLAVAALGLLVVVGWAKEVSLAQAGLTGTAVYLCAYAMRGGTAGWGWPFLAAAAFAIAVTVAISIVIALATAKLSGIYIMILTLAVQFTIERTFFTTRRLVQTDPRYPLSRPAFLGIHLTSDRAYYLFALGVLCALILFLSRLRSSRFGRALMLAGTDRQAASSVGVSPWRAKIFAFAIAGFCAGLAGVLIAPLYPTPPSYIGFVALQSLIYLAIPVLAGFRSLIGVATVAMGFAVAPQALEHFHLSPFFLGAVGLIGGTLVGSSGLSGLVFDLLENRRSRAARVAREADVDLRQVAVSTNGHGPVSASRANASALRVVEDYLPHDRVDEGNVLVANQISVAFGGLKANDEVSITVPARHLVGLIGPNGAGKSTLFDVLNGLRVPDSGEISLFGQDVSKASPWERAALGMSRTFQSSRVNLDLSVGENLLAGAYLMIPGGLVESVAGLPRARTGAQKAEAAGRAFAEILDIADHWDDRVRNLDFGSQRRVEIGRSLMSGPRLLLLDEPAAGLDVHEAEALFVLLRELEQDLGLTVLLVEHYVKAVLEQCDLVYVLSQGRLIAAGSPNEVAANPEVQAVYLGTTYERGDQYADA